MGKIILTINPGSTSTKIAIFDDEKEVFEKTLRHATEEIGQFKDIQDQYEFRTNVIMEAVKESGIALKDFDAIVGRGGLFPKPQMESGVYPVTEKMIDDIINKPVQAHASNLGCRLAQAFANEANCEAYIVDPVVVDEMQEVARVSTHAGIKRKSMFHALNQKAIGYQLAKDLNKEYKDLNIIVAHLGGGVSVGAHQNGKVIDVNKALLGEGPMSPERTGTIPLEDAIELTYQNKEKSLKEIKKMFVGHGGMASFTGMTDMRDVEAKSNEDKDVALYYEAFTYQVAKEIGACATVLSGKVDAIALTGGIAYSKKFIELVSNRINWIAPVYVYPGEEEMLALAQGALRIMNGTEKPKTY